MIGQIKMTDVPSFFEGYVDKVQAKIPELQSEYRESLGERLYAPLLPQTYKSIIRGFQRERIISPQTNILTFGSCFAQEVGKWLKTKNYKVRDDLWGVLYNVKTFEQMVNATLKDREFFDLEPLLEVDDGFCFPFLKSSDHKSGILMGKTYQEAYTNLQTFFCDSREALMGAEVIIFTLGMTECWRSNKTDLVYYTNPAFIPSKKSKSEVEGAYFYNLSFMDVVASLQKSLDILKLSNKSLKFIISVSPVPLLMTYGSGLGAYVANSYSKSINLAAAFSVCQSRSDTFYMPAYEIVTADPSTSFKVVDGRHVTERRIHDVMRGFEELYTSDGYLFK